MTKSSKTYYTATEVADIMGCKPNTAYKYIAKLNAKLEEQGFLIMPGKINKRFFRQHYLMDDDVLTAQGD